MYITLTGELGSGKSSVAEIFKEKHGFTIYSTGAAQRDIAKDLGMTVLELNRYMAEHLDNNYDKMLDAKTVEVASNCIGQNILFDSRLAWHFVEDSFKVFIIVDKYAAAERVMNVGRGAVENYTSNDEAIKSLKERKELENKRFYSMYNVNMMDYNNFDLVVDSTNLTPEELVDFIYKKATQYAKGNTCEVYLSPDRLYPTQVFRDINPELVEEMKANIRDNEIDIVIVGDKQYIIDGHHRTCAAIQRKDKLIRARVINRIAPIFISKSTYYDWEDYNKIKFNEYPDSTEVNNSECPVCGGPVAHLSTGDSCWKCSWGNK